MGPTLKKNETQSRYPFMVRAIALSLLTAFVVQDLGHAAPAELLSRNLAENPSILKISPGVARIEEIHRGSRNRLLIHVQDAHTNVSGQQNLAKVLEELITRYGVKTVFVEGGQQDNSLKSLRPLAPLSTRRQVAKKYLLRGELSGDEYLSLASDHEFQLWGVEESALYDKNLKKYAAVVEKREEALGYVAAIVRRSDGLKRRLWPKETLEFDDFLRRFDKKEKDFTEYHRVLTEAAKRSGVKLADYPNFSSLKDLRAKEEKIDFASANREQEKLVRALFADDTDRDLAMTHLAERLKRVQSEAHTPVAFYRSLLDDAKARKIRLKEYPNLLRYVDYLRAYARVDMAKLLDENEAIEREVYRLGLTDTKAYYLYEISEHLSNLERLFSLQASKGDFLAHVERRAENRFETMMILAFLNRELCELGNFADVLRYRPSVNANVAEVEDFYRVTEERDHVFLEKAFAKMDAEKTDVAVLITGGYHTPHVKELMKAHGVSYAVVTPNVTEETNLRRYEEILLGQLGSDNPLVKERRYAATERNTADGLQIKKAMIRVNSPIPSISQELTRGSALPLSKKTADESQYATAAARMASLEARREAGKATVGSSPEPAVSRAAETVVSGARIAEAPYLRNLLEGVGERTPDWARMQLISAIFIETDQPSVPLRDILGKAYERLRARGLDVADNDQKTIEILNRLVDLGLLRRDNNNFSLAASKRLLAVKMNHVQFIRSELSAAVAGVAAQRSGADGVLTDLIRDYARITALWYRAPIESRYPFLKAVSFLDQAERELLGGFVAARTELNVLPLGDAIMLNTLKEPPTDWLERNAPNLKGRTIYYVSPETWLVEGGLGPVGQYHSVWMKRLVRDAANVVTIEPYYPFKLARNRETGRNELVPNDYTKLPVPAEGLAVAYEFDVQVRGEMIKAQVYKGKNKFGIETYFIKDTPEKITRLMYRYGQYGTGSWEEFCEFLSRATEQLQQILETEKQAKEGAAYKPAVISLNDGQLGLFPAYKRQSDESKDPRRHALSKALVWFVTHTYRNRGIFGFANGSSFLLGAGVPQKMMPYFRRIDTYDATSGGRRMADGTSAVSDTHGVEVAPIDPQIVGYSITNGDDRDQTGEVFIRILRELFPDADIDRPTPAQVLAVKLEAKTRLKTNPVLVGLNPEIANIDPARPVIGYYGRLVEEKAGRERAFTDSNLRELVKMGVTVIHAGKVQGHTQAMHDELVALAAEINEAGPGKLIILTGYSTPEKVAMLAATDFQIQDSDRGTEAAGFTESNINRVGGMMGAATGIEGIQQQQGILVNREKPGEGNTIVPSADTPEAWLERYRWFVDAYASDVNAVAQNMAMAVPMSMMLDASLTSAEYLRQFSHGLDRKENPLAVLEAFLSGDAEVRDALTNEWLRKNLVQALDAAGTSRIPDSNERLRTYVVEMKGRTFLLSVDMQTRNAFDEETRGNLQPAALGVFLNKIGASANVEVRDVRTNAVYDRYESAALRERGLGVIVRGPGVQLLEITNSGARMATPYAQFAMESLGRLEETLKEWLDKLQPTDLAAARVSLTDTVQRPADIAVAIEELRAALENIVVLAADGTPIEVLRLAFDRVDAKLRLVNSIYRATLTPEIQRMSTAIAGTNEELEADVERLRLAIDATRSLEEELKIPFAERRTFQGNAEFQKALAYAVDMAFSPFFMQRNPSRPRAPSDVQIEPARSLAAAAAAATGELADIEGAKAALFQTLYKLDPYGAGSGARAAAFVLPVLTDVRSAVERAIESAAGGTGWRQMPDLANISDRMDYDPAYAAALRVSNPLTALIAELFLQSLRVSEAMDAIDADPANFKPELVTAVAAKLRASPVFADKLRQIVHVLGVQDEYIQAIGLAETYLDRALQAATGARMAPAESRIADSYVPGIDDNVVRVKSVKTVAVVGQAVRTAGSYETDRPELVHATNIAAQRVMKWKHDLGSRNSFTKDQGDGETTFWLREYYNHGLKNLKGEIVIGEGERDEAPMLFIGERVGGGFTSPSEEPETDIAIDVLELTNGIVREAIQGSVSIAAYAPRGGLMNAPDLYISKWVVGPQAKGAGVSVEKKTADNLNAIATKTGKPVSALKGGILFRPRHIRRVIELLEGGIDVGGDSGLLDLVAKFKASQASRDLPPSPANEELIRKTQDDLDRAFKALDKRVKDVGILRVGNLFLLADGDLTPTLALASSDDFAMHLDFMTGAGGAPEGVLTATLVKAIDGEMSARLVSAERLSEKAAHSDLDRDGAEFSDYERERLEKFGFANPNAEHAPDARTWDSVLTHNGLVPAEDFATIASAVKNNPWVPGLAAPSFDPVSGDLTVNVVRAGSSGEIKVFKVVYETVVQELRRQINILEIILRGSEDRQAGEHESAALEVAGAYYRLGRILAVYQRYDEAIAAFEAARYYDPSRANYFRAGEAHARGLRSLIFGLDAEGRTAEDFLESAAASFARSLELSQDARDPHLRTLETLVDLYEFLGDQARKAKNYDLARSLYEKRLEKNPDGDGIREKMKELPMGARIALPAQSASYTSTYNAAQAYMTSVGQTLTQTLGVPADSSAVSDSALKTINRHPLVGTLQKADPLRLNADFLSTPDAGPYRQKAEDSVASGEFVKLMLWGGQATRAASILGGGAKSLFTLRNFASLDLDLIPLADYGGKDAAENQLVKDELKAFQKQAQAAAANLDPLEQYLLDLSLGAHEVIQYRAELEKLAQKRGVDAEAFVKANGKLVVSINSEAGPDIVDEWIDNNFFGFDRKNVLFLQANVFPTFVRNDKGEFVPMDAAFAQANGLTAPVRHVFGHGIIASDLNAAGTSFTIDDAGQVAVESVSPYQYMSARGGKVISNANIDDNPQLTPEALPVDRLALLLYMKDKFQKDTIFEGLLNATGQKGGSAATQDGSRDFTAEGPALADSDAATQAFTGQNPFLNRMLTFTFIASQMKPDTTPMTLTKKTHSNGFAFYYPEYYFTDMFTARTDSKSFQQEGVVINAFKAPVNVAWGVLKSKIPGTGPMMLDQHKDAEFRDVAARVQASKASGARIPTEVEAPILFSSADPEFKLLAFAFAAKNAPALLKDARVVRAMADPAAPLALEILIGDDTLREALAREGKISISNDPADAFARAAVVRVLNDWSFSGSLETDLAEAMRRAALPENGGQDYETVAGNIRGVFGARMAATPTDYVYEADPETGITRLLQILEESRMKTDEAEREIRRTLAGKERFDAKVAVIENKTYVALRVPSERKAYVLVLNPGASDGSRVAFVRPQGSDISASSIPGGEEGAKAFSLAIAPGTLRNPEAKPYLVSSSDSSKQTVIVRLDTGSLAYSGNVLGAAKYMVSKDIVVLKPAAATPAPSGSAIAGARLPSRTLTLRQVNAFRVESGLHTEIGAQPPFQAVAPERIGRFGEIMRQNRVMVGVDNAALVAETRRQSPEAVIFLHLQKSDLEAVRRGVEAGANVVVLPDATPERVDAIRTDTVASRAVLFSTVDDTAPDVKAALDAALRSGTEGVLLKRFDRVEQALVAAGYPLTRLRSEYPALLIGAAGGIFENRVAQVLGRPERLIAFVGINQTEPDAFEDQVLNYADAVRTVIRTRGSVAEYRPDSERFGRFEEFLERLRSLGVPPAEVEAYARPFGPLGAFAVVTRTGLRRPDGTRIRFAAVRGALEDALSIFRIVSRPGETARIEPLSFAGSPNVPVATVFQALGREAVEIYRDPFDASRLRLSVNEGAGRTSVYALTGEGSLERLPEAARIVEGLTLAGLTAEGASNPLALFARADAALEFLNTLPRLDASLAGALVDEIRARAASDPRVLSHLESYVTALETALRPAENEIEAHLRTYGQALSLPASELGERLSVRRNQFTSPAYRALNEEIAPSGTTRAFLLSQLRDAVLTARRTVAERVPERPAGARLAIADIRQAGTRIAAHLDDLKPGDPALVSYASTAPRLGVPVALPLLVYGISLDERGAVSVSTVEVTTPAELAAVQNPGVTPETLARFARTADETRRFESRTALVGEVREELRALRTGVETPVPTASVPTAAPEIADTRTLLSRFLDAIPSLGKLVFWMRSNWSIYGVSGAAVDPSILGAAPQTTYVVGMPYAAVFDENGYDMTVDFQEGARVNAAKLERAGFQGTLMIAITHRGDPLARQARELAEAKLAAHEQALAGKVRFTLVELSKEEKLADGLDAALASRFPEMKRSGMSIGLAVNSESPENVAAEMATVSADLQKLKAQGRLNVFAVQRPGANETISFAGVLVVATLNAAGLDLSNYPELAPYLKKTDSGYGFVIVLVKPQPLTADLEILLLSKRATDSAA